jgi:hypothetical protein
MPSYIKAAKVSEDPISHEWSETDEENLLNDNPSLRARISAISFRGQLAFAAGTAEWVAWRFSRFLEDQTACQALEAVWAGQIDRRYVRSLDMPEWEAQYDRPIGGALGQAFWLLREAYVAFTRSQPLSQFATPLSAVALHVLPRPEPYKEWRRATIARLTKLYPMRDDDKLGPPVPREALDPGRPFDPNSAHTLLSEFLQTLEHQGNPHLYSPDELSEAGFQGTPYRL